MYSVISNQFNLGDDTAVYPEVSVILNIVKDPALGRRGALASVATTGGLSPQRSLTQRDVREILHSVQDDTNAEIT